VTAPLVVKLGGASAAGALPQVLALAERHPRVCVVHGGGPQISAAMARRGLTPRFERGRRVTDAAALECVVEGLSAVSQDLCDALEAAGRPASALLSGAVSAERDPFLGLVGTHPGLTEAGAAAVEHAFRLSRIPVIGPLAEDQHHGETLLNVNADDVAAAIAAGLGASELLFLSDVPGVLDANGQLIPSIAASRPPAAAQGGMLPKLEACATAVAAGVGLVRIGACGTVVTA
jgi:acetylglutamate kinase